LMALEKESPTLTDPDLKDVVGEVIQKLKKELADMP
jgi:hypothetical protein